MSFHNYTLIEFNINLWHCLLVEAKIGKFFVRILCIDSIDEEDRLSSWYITFEK